LNVVQGSPGRAVQVNLTASGRTAVAVIAEAIVGLGAPRPGGPATPVNSPACEPGWTPLPRSAMTRPDPPAPPPGVFAGLMPRPSPEQAGSPAASTST
jgi:hypothetical protein